METKKAKRKPSARADQSTEESPLSIFPNGPGKPSPTDNYLFNRRDALIVLLQSDWYQIHWPLASAKTRKEVRAAFCLIFDNSNASALAPLIRASDFSSSIESVRQIGQELGNAVKAQRLLEQLFQKGLLAVQDAEGRNFNLSDEYNSQLKTDLRKRESNLRDIGIQISRVNGGLRQLRLRRRSDRDTARTEGQAEQANLGRLQHQREDDEKACADLKKQIDSITPERDAIMASALTRAKESLNMIEGEVAEARRRTQKLECKLQDREAFFFQTQILEFLKEDRYVLTARNLANAIAGLPYMKARRSAERCAALKSKLPIAPNQKLLDFLISVWQRRRKRKAVSLVDWSEQEIKRLPKFKIVGKKKLPNEFRAGLCENWYHLRKAIEESTRGNPAFRTTPYAITEKFLNRIGGPQDPVDLTLAESEKIAT